MESVHITGMGLVTSIGNDRNAVTKSLREMKHGIEHHPELQGDDSPVKLAGTVKEFDVESSDPEDWTYPDQYRVPRATLRSFSPHVLYAWCALQQAIKDAGLSEEEIKDPEAWYVHTPQEDQCGPSTNTLKKWMHGELWLVTRLQLLHPLPVALAFNLVAALGIRGSSTGLVSACASSGHALGMALDEIRLGRQKRMLVIGAEDCNFESIVPFCGMRALSLDTDPDTASRSFDVTRNGFVGNWGFRLPRFGKRVRGKTEECRILCEVCRLGARVRRSQCRYFPP